jgi:hypothetical protein
MREIIDEDKGFGYHPSPSRGGDGGEVIKMIFMQNILGNRY